MHNFSSLNTKGFLKYKLSHFETIELPQCFRMVNMQMIIDPHSMTEHLYKIQRVLINSPFTVNLMGICFEELNSLIAECKRTSTNAHMLCRKLNQSVQRILYERDYDKLIPAMQEFMRMYPLFNVTQKAVSIAREIIPYCEDELLSAINNSSEYLHLITSDYHMFCSLIIPMDKIYIEFLKRITSALMNGSPDIELTYNYFKSDKYLEDLDLVSVNYLIKLQEIAPNYVNKLQCSTTNL